eukprot:2597196-Alexandrium_andersonii.AAC.1
MCIRDRLRVVQFRAVVLRTDLWARVLWRGVRRRRSGSAGAPPGVPPMRAVSYTHLRAHETSAHL